MGFKHSIKTKELISQNRRGKNTGKRPQSLINKISGKNNYAWKGDKASYFAIHAKIQRQKGKAKKCEHCGTEKGKIEWANKDHEYSRNPEDYISLCVRCHRKYDVENGIYNFYVFGRLVS